MKNTSTDVEANPNKESCGEAARRGQRPELNARDSHWFGASAVFPRRTTPPGLMQEEEPPLSFHSPLLLVPFPIVSASMNNAKGNWVFSSDESCHSPSRRVRAPWLVDCHSIHSKVGGRGNLGNLFLFVPGEEREQQHAIYNSIHGSQTASFWEDNVTSDINTSNYPHLSVLSSKRSAWATGTSLTIRCQLFMCQAR